MCLVLVFLFIFRIRDMIKNYKRSFNSYFAKAIMVDSFCNSCMVGKNHLGNQ